MRPTRLRRDEEVALWSTSGSAVHFRTFSYKSLDQEGLFWYSLHLQKPPSEELRTLIYLQIFLTGLVLFNQVLYIRAISVGRSSSTAVTWLIWSFVNAVMSWTQYKSGNTASAVVIAAYSFGALGSFVYSMKKGRWKLSAVQVACLVISLTALSVAIFSSKVLAISINVSAHFVGTVPIFLLVFARKSREPIECWVIWLVASSSNLLIALYGKELLIAPVYYCVHNIILVSLLLALQTKEKKNINDTV